MNNTPLNCDIYPPHVLAALDGVLDALPAPEAIALEDRVMAALHARATTGECGALAEIAAQYPALACLVESKSAAA